MSEEKNIEIACKSSGDYAVRYGGTWADRLTRGEALEVVVAILFASAHGHPYIKTSEEWAARQMRMAGLPEAPASGDDK